MASGSILRVLPACTRAYMLIIRFHCLQLSDGRRVNIDGYTHNYRIPSCMHCMSYRNTTLDGVQGRMSRAT